MVEMMAEKKAESLVAAKAETMADWWDPMMVVSKVERLVGTMVDLMAEMMADKMAAMKAETKVS